MSNINSFSHRRSMSEKNKNTDWQNAFIITKNYNYSTTNIADNVTKSGYYVTSTKFRSKF